MNIVRWIGSYFCDVPRFDGTCPIDTLLAKMEYLVLETQRIQTMDVLVKGTPMRWWETHRRIIQDWAQVVECLKVRFHPSTNFELVRRYKGTKDPQEHIWFYERHQKTKKIPRAQWVHRFSHTIDTVPKICYNQEAEQGLGKSEHSVLCKIQVVGHVLCSLHDYNQ